jgi:hypothetical protein
LVVKRIARALLLLAVAMSVSAQQPPPRRATNLAALLAFPGFYHLRPIVVVGNVSRQDNGETRMTDDAGSVGVLFKGNVPDGPAEVRGEFWDLGRMNVDDPRLAGYDLRTAFRIDPEGAWPRPSQVMAIVASAVDSATSPPAPSIRSLVLFPSRYLGQTVTVTGQFGGRNLLGELPDAPAKSRWDFVLRSVDAAIWVTNLRPRGGDFELSLDTRIDTGRWVEVSGTLQQGRGLLWLDAAPNSLKLTKAPTETALEAPIRVAAAPPPEVLFSAPIDDESDVPLSTNIRIQFSRDIDPATLKGNVQVTYDEKETAIRGEPVNPTAEFTTEYSAGNRRLEIRFTSELERFRTIRVQLGEGILGTDKQPLKPWTLTFHTGP